jgi:(E)-4-hydroxy-3-methylbut-2-enyl-diphosphate synthase
VDGRLMKTLRGEHIVEEFRTILDNYVSTRYGVAEMLEPVAQ